MGWNNLIFGSQALHSVAKSYSRVANYITTFLEPSPPTIVITNQTILNQYSIKQVLKVLRKKSRVEYKKSGSSSMAVELLRQKILKTSAMNNEERAWHT